MLLHLSKVANSSVDALIHELMYNPSFQFPSTSASASNNNILSIGYLNHCVSKKDWVTTTISAPATSHSVMGMGMHNDEVVPEIPVLGHEDYLRRHVLKIINDQLISGIMRSLINTFEDVSIILTSYTLLNNSNSYSFK